MKRRWLNWVGDMVDQICAIFCEPPLAFARLGGSTTPLAAYRWASPANPRTDGNTVISPAWSLNILPDGEVDPFLPQNIRFRDGDLLRPVCPFVEVWVRVGDPAGDPSTWRDAPLTPALLAAEARSEADLSFTVTARNLKAHRRTGDADLAFGTYPDLVVIGDDHAVHELLGVSPPGAATPMIPLGRHIGLGSVQVLKSRAQPAAGATPWAAEVNVETIRLRFTPAAGLTYGPPAAAAADVENGPAVQPARAFLNANAGWFGADGTGRGFVIPGDTFDTRIEARSQPSLGVIDDTCEARITVALGRGPQDALVAHANLFSAPPDYAPDRRPIVSIADELNDRAADGAARNAALTADEREDWVADLFERIYETVSLLNVDLWRNVNALDQNGNPIVLPADKLRAAIPGDGLAQPTRPMGGRDALRNPDLKIGQATAQTPLPLTAHARERHRDLAGVEALRTLVRSDPQRLTSLVRGPFESEQVSPQFSEGLRRTTMRMPPFMAQSTFTTPLTLTAWQYDLLMAWAAAQLAPPPAPLLAPAPPLSVDADLRRATVLRRLDAAAINR